MQTITSKVADEYFPNSIINPIVDLQNNIFNTSNIGYEALNVQANINDLADICHAAAAVNGWWHSPNGIVNVGDGNPQTTFELKRMNVGERIALMHSELSEALEAARKDLPSDHIPEFTGMEEEFADTLIRIFDMAGAMKLRLGEAFVAKLRYNAERADHKMENRMAEGGKKL